MEKFHQNYEIGMQMVKSISWIMSQEGKGLSKKKKKEQFHSIVKLAMIFLRYKSLEIGSEC